MKKILATTFFALLSSSAFAQVHVDGHTRKDGSYVPPHSRSAPDKSYNNNYGTQPNTNPYTGKSGQNQPTWNDKPPPSNNYLGGNRRY